MSQISPLQLRDYSIESLHVDANPDFKAGEVEEVESKLSVDFNFKRNESAPMFRVDLDVQVNPTDGSYAKAPYRIQIKTQTFLEFDASFPEKDIPNLLGLNGLAMAYSIARGIIGQATGTAIHGKFILPTVNFIELLKAKTKAAGGSRKTVQYEKALNRIAPGYRHPHC